MLLKRELESMGFSTDDLDSVVSDAIAEMESRINNGGLRAQLRFLEEEGFSDAEIIAKLKENGSPFSAEG